MRIVFAGTPDFAVASLRGLLAAGRSTLAVYTQPDRPAGRGRQLRASAVKQYATEQGLTVEQPDNLGDSKAQHRFRAYRADLLVVVAYGQILPKELLQIPAHGAINVHASLLPRWRGAAPIQRALLAGDAQTGITIMQLDEGLDTGDILSQHVVPIEAGDTAGQLHDRLAELGAESLVAAIAGLEAGSLSPHLQPATGATYANKISSEERVIDWHQNAAQIARLIRALNPSPVATTLWEGQPMKIWRASALEQTTAEAEPGTVLRSQAGGILVATGKGALRIECLQAAGGKAMTAANFLTGRPVPSGETSLTAVAGRAGEMQRTLEFSNAFLTGIYWKETSDAPCRMGIVGWRPSQDGSEAGEVRDTLTLGSACRDPIIALWDSGNSVDLDHPSEAAVGRIEVCNNTNRRYRLKGIRIWGDRINDDGSSTYVPNSDQRALPNCDTWSGSMLCGSGKAATGLVVHASDVGGGNGEITGLQLICRSISTP